MKEQFAILPELPIVGCLKLGTRDGVSLSSITVLRKQTPSELTPFFTKCYKTFDKFLHGKSKEIELPLDLSGLSPFHAKVLREIKKIPYGEVSTYKGLALGMKTKGYQAIGSACGRNPFMLIYPCHRVLGSSGIGGFAHGLKMKQGLLKLESADK